MQLVRSNNLQLLLQLLTGILILKVIVVVLLSFQDYIPPNFESGFLRGRRGYFSGIYQWAFYAHIVSGPCSLAVGLVLLSERFRRRFTAWHRFLGRLQVPCVLLLVTPSGLWMSFYAETGAIAGAGFTVLALVTGLCVVFGWRAAVQRRFADHQHWMLRCYALLCSAIVIRIIGGAATAIGTEAQWVYPAAAWTSWLVPLGLLELLELLQFGRRLNERSPDQLIDRKSETDARLQ